MRPALPSRPSFSRYGSLRQNHDPSSGDESDAGVNTRGGDTTDDAASDQLSVSFSEVDDTDSLQEVNSVKEKTIEEEEEVDSGNPTPVSTPAKTVNTKPPLPAEHLVSRFNGSESLGSKLRDQREGSSSLLRQTPVFQKTPSSETVKCNVVLKPPSASSSLSTTSTTPTPVVAQQHKVPLVPGGFVGFASLPDQVYR